MDIVWIAALAVLWAGLGRMVSGLAGSSAGRKGERS